MAYQKAASFRAFKSLLIVRNGKLIAEGYFANVRPSSLLHQRSVTKTVMAMLIGIALDEGYLRDIDQPIGDFFVDDID